MDHDYLNSSANLRSLKLMEGSDGVRLILPDPEQAVAIVDLTIPTNESVNSRKVDETGGSDKAPCGHELVVSL